MRATEILGNDLMLFVDGKSVALATNHTMTLSTEMVDTSNKDTGVWNSGIPGKMSWELTSENMYSVDYGTAQTGYKSLVKMWMERKAIEVHFGIPENAAAEEEIPDEGWTLPTGDYKGKAYITNITANAPNQQSATFTISLQGAGKLEEVVPA